MDATSNPAFVLFAAFAPLLIAFVKQSAFTPQVNAMIALACYVVIGVAGVFMSGEPVTPENLTSLIATATIVGSAAYNLIWNNIGKTSDDAPSLDARLTEATSLLKG